MTIEKPSRNEDEYFAQQNAELLRLQSGMSDLSNSELRPEDYVPVRRAEEQGRLRLIELGVPFATEGDAFHLTREGVERVAGVAAGHLD